MASGPRTGTGAPHAQGGLQMHRPALQHASLSQEGYELGSFHIAMSTYIYMYIYTSVYTSNASNVHLEYNSSPGNVERNLLLRMDEIIHCLLCLVTVDDCVMRAEVLPTNSCMCFVELRTNSCYNAK